MRPKLNSDARIKKVNYGATITLEPGSGDVLAVIGMLTGNLALNIVDPFASLGDKLMVMFSTDATPRVVTISGAQGANGTVNINGNGVGAVNLIFNGSKYISPSTPT